MSKQNMAYKVDTVGVGALSEFFDQYSSAYRKIEQSLLLLEIEPDDEQLIGDLIQAVQQIQRALQNIGFDELLALTESLGEMLQTIQHKELDFQTVLSDIILLAVNDIRTILEKIIDGDTRCVLLQRMPRVCEAIVNIKNADQLYQDSVIKDTLLLLDPSTEIIESTITEQASLVNLFEEAGPDEEELVAYGVEENEDFIFFRGLSEPLESRAHYWRGRSQRMLRLALKMNEHAGRPVDPNQLAAAVYMHDAGMALLPMDIINADGSLRDEDIEQIKQHPLIGYELLRYMKQWREAANIVLQHHERVDGTGYPYQLKNDEICEGAKILAIVDAIDARTHERAHSTLLKRPLLRAAMEIGKHSDTQFSAYWVDIFKKVFQQMRKQATSDDLI
ncbi:MAG: HD domain-containing protein [Gammaproteobacteria bacterium]|nr:HD domain-containing protein [Gammaproteobacteria bacterium]